LESADRWEAAGGKFIGGWLCFGEYDAVFIADMPNDEGMAGVALAIAAGGAAQGGQDDGLDDGRQGMETLKKAASVAKTYRPAQ
jgi:hypothetical protein